MGESRWFSCCVKEIAGIRWGYKGCYTETDKNWLKLQPRDVADIHKLGGTFLGSSRGGFSGDKILNACLDKRISQVYVVGGDGTHRGIYNLCKMAEERGLNISFTGIPKTIDNDVPLIDRSFGFNTAVAESIKFIDSAEVEATSAENGIGIVRLMGRYCGYIAVQATLASRDVNICLIPEVYF